MFRALSRMRFAIPALAFLLGAFDARALERGSNLVVNSSFEQEGGWTMVGEGFQIDRELAHSGRQSLRCTGTNLQSSHGAKQVITLAQPIRHPFHISAWSRAQDAEVGQDYDLFLDVFHEDGTPLWGQIAHFQPGTHDWQKAELTFEVTKPVKRIEVHVLFRKAKGTVWFDDIEVSLAPFSFTKLQVLPHLFGAGTLALSAHTSLPARWTATLEGPGNLRLQENGERLPIRAQWTNIFVPATKTGEASECRLRLSATDSILGETITKEQTIPLKPAGQSEPSCFGLRAACCG